MPLYEYRCDACELTFEELVSASDPKAACPSCQSPKVERQMSTFAAHGTGPVTTRIASASKKASPGTCGNGGCGHC